MRRILVLVLLASTAVLAVPATSSAALRVGISENNPEMFTDPLFLDLGVKRSRVVVSYNILEAAARGDNEIDRVTRYIDSAVSFGIEPLVTFEHARGDASRCARRSNHKLSQCKLPSVAEYTANIRAFLQRFPSVRVIAPWNEFNHFTQATSRNPRRAAQFTNAAAKVCKQLKHPCKIVAMDVLDQADNVRAKRPTFRATKRMIKKFRGALRVPRRICGIHNYSDTNRFRSTGTKALIKAMGCKEYWLTETGGVYNFASFRKSASRQKRATRYMFRLAQRNRRIKRLYVYTWFGFPAPAGITVSPRFDAGLVAGGKPRPAYFEVKKRV